MNSNTSIIIFSALCATVLPLSAATFGEFSYTDNGNTITITGYPRNATGAVSIPEKINGKPVTAIGPNAFTGCTDLTSVSIPASVTNIQIAAFQNCSSLTSVTIPASVTNIQIAAFHNCSSLTSVTIPSGVTSLADFTFAGCSGLTNVFLPEGVAKINGNVFDGCSSLTNVTIPSSVTVIGSQAFRSCTGFTSVTIPSGVAYIGNQAFDYCTSLTSATFLGNAPGMGAQVFYKHPKGFTIYYIDGSTGYTTPLWNGHPAVKLSAAPDIQVQQPVGTVLVDGMAKKSYGTVTTGVTSNAKTFTVSNTGLSDLMGLKISLNGINAADFKLTPIGMTSLPPGSKAVFKITFTPTAPGTRRAAIVVKSNDADENPFDIQLSGMGVAVNPRP